MDRRQFVTAVGMGLTPLAGCATLSGETNETPTLTPTATGTPTPDPTATPTPSPEPTPAQQMPATATAKYQEPDSGNAGADVPDAYREEDIGSRENVETPVFGKGDNRPHTVYIYRTTPEPAYFEVQVADTAVDEVLLHGVYHVPMDRSLQIHLNEPSDYAVNLYDVDYENGWTITIKKRTFTCNPKGHRFKSIEGGDFRWNVHQTLKRCD